VLKASVLAAAVALGVGLCSASLGAAAGNRNEVQVRRTVSCATKLGALQISAFATNPSIGTANVSITTGDPNNSPTGLLGLSSQQPRYGLGGACRSVTKPVALSHRGLVSAGVVHSGDIRWPTAFCGASRRVLVRFALALSSSGKPVSATIAIATQPTAHGKKSKPIGFVQWSPSRSVTYHAPSCTTQEQ
jgi:hypothetical protein